MLKFNALLTAPVNNRSGYGVYSNFIARALLTYEPFDLAIIPQNFGSNIPSMHVTELDRQIQAKMPKAKIPMPHIHISCQLPHLQKPQGMILSINYNAGFETSFTHPNIMEGLNKWSHCNVMSQFAKKVYEDSTPTPTTPITVCNPGIDTDIFRPDAPTNDKVNYELNKLSESEAYLFVGQLTHPNPMLDRKQMGLLIKLFCETFQGHANKPALILKTAGVNYGATDRYQILSLIRAIKAPDVTVALLHGELSDSEMAALYTHPKIVGHVTLTRGEGYGLPLLEASMSAKPIFAPDYSGHLDFLGDKFVKLPGQLDEIPVQAVSEYYPAHSRWFNINPEAFKASLLNYNNGQRNSINKAAVALAKRNHSLFDLKTTIAKQHAWFDQILTKAL